jgi:hypothetical protein
MFSAKRRIKNGHPLLSAARPTAECYHLTRLSTIFTRLAGEFSKRPLLHHNILRRRQFPTGAGAHHGPDASKLPRLGWVEVSDVMDKAACYSR